MYLLAPLTAALISAICGAAILARDASHRTNRLAAMIVFGCAFWASCEVLWNTADDPDVVLRLIRLSALGWIGIGPAFFELMLSATSQLTPFMRRLRLVLYPGLIGLLLCTWFTPLVTRSAVRTSWGWAYETGPLMPFFYLITASSVLPGIAVGWRAFQRSRSASERQQARLLVIGVTVPLVIASATDGILPMLGVQWPRFGTLSLAVLCACIGYTQTRYGYSVLAPGRFQKEVYDVLPAGIAVLHLDGTLRTGNEELARLVRSPVAALEGSRLLDRIDLEIGPESELRDRESTLQPVAGESLPVSVSTTLLRDKTAAPIAMLLVARDLREVTGLRRRLATRDRLAAVGQLAAGVAHEVNNPLSFAIANLNLLRAGWPKLAASLRDDVGGDVAELAGETEEILDEAIEGVERAIEIVRHVKTFARGGDSSFAPCELSDVVASSLRFARPHFAPGLRVETRCAPLPPVQAACQELEQVVLNLLLNAAQAVGERGSIRIETLRRGDLAVLAVEDDGPGIAAHVIGRIFDPFFTTKPVGEGTGLGLAVSHEIIRSHGGDLRVESGPDGGTRFEFELPLQPDPPQ